jgi:uncharacterized protein YrrD
LTTISAKELYGMPCEAEDGSIGSVHDLYFDDQSWHVRYFVVDTARWLPGREVLIAPEALHRPWGQGAGLRLNLTRQQVKASPDVDTARPLSREAELMLFNHYGWIPYWAEGIMPPPPPLFAVSREQKQEAAAMVKQLPGSHLRSSREVVGYRLKPANETGPVPEKVDDMLIDMDAVAIRYLVIGTGEWLARKKLLIPSGSISSIEWADATVVVRMSHDEILNSPEYDAKAYV